MTEENTPESSHEETAAKPGAETPAILEAETPTKLEEAPVPPEGETPAKLESEAQTKPEETAAKSETPAKAEESVSSGRKLFSRGLILRILSFIWIPLAFYIPYTYTYKAATRDYVGNAFEGRTKATSRLSQWRLDDAESEAMRSGRIGMAVALAIYLLWRLDRRLRKKEDLTRVWMILLLGVFATLLWTVWTCAGHVMVKANDEISPPAALPGLGE